MAKFVIAGKADCPYLAKIELLADSLAINVPDFKVHKILVQPNEWETWLSTICEERGWTHTKSPIVWRELVNRGGKGMLLGGANEFQEYARGYYGAKSGFSSDDMRKIAQENLHTQAKIDEEIKRQRAENHPVRLCITSAGSQLCYAMIKDIANGEAIGKDTEIALHLYDLSTEVDAMMSAEMEAFDLASSVLKDTLVTSDLTEAFSNCNAIILLDELLQTEEETKDEWLRRNYELFASYGKLINVAAQKDVKIIIAGSGPVNLNALAIIHNAPNVAKQNVVALSRTVENQCKAILSDKLQVNSAGIANMIVWGNVNGSHYIDTSKTRVFGYDGAIWGPASFSLSAVDMVHDNRWLSTVFLQRLEKRTKELETMLNHQPTMSQAAAVVTMMSHWWNGSPNGQIFSLGVLSEGWYELPEDIVISLPVMFSPKGYWVVVQDIELSQEVKQKIKDIAQELVAEKESVMGPPKPKIVTVEEPVEKTPVPPTPPKTPGQTGEISIGEKSILEPTAEEQNTTGESPSDTKEDSSD